MVRHARVPAAYREGPPQNVTPVNVIRFRISYTSDFAVHNGRETISIKKKYYLEVLSLCSRADSTRHVSSDRNEIEREIGRVPMIIVRNLASLLVMNMYMLFLM